MFFRPYATLLVAILLSVIAIVLSHSADVHPTERSMPTVRHVV